MSHDSSDIDNALIAKLGSDVTLLALCPNGIHKDEAPAGMTRFVIVSLVDEVDVATYDKGRAYEDALYLVEARMRSDVGANIKAAAARIDVLLEDQPLSGSPTLIPGYTWMTTYRESRLTPQVEVDDVDPTIRWYRRGGHYRVQCSVT